MSRENPFPQQLRQARLRCSLSLRNLGIRIGMDSGSTSGRINHYEKGRHAPDIDTLQRLAEELNVPLIFLHGRLFLQN
ncbi:helix-turn-helix transcriptional regulator [Enterobacter hormaechei]|uniref:helix-turn-helix domain-containing protein n=1 Tax=Enterobacter TaxID=547 RepID=UPI0020321AC2|nr:helix-turn-helix transcriptional regulator [Enterobacter mori]